MKRCLFSFIVLSITLLTACGSGMETVSLRLAGEVFTVEVARTPKERETGLMFRKDLRANAGMIFVFDRDERLSFWMKNTEIPLSIAYISSEGEIKEIYDMTPRSQRPIESTFAVRYALEVPKGTFDRLGIKPGYKISLPELRTR